MEYRMSELWPILILGFVAFVTSFGAHVVAVNLPAYAAQVGVGVAMIGLLIAAYDAAEVVAKPVFGALADRRGMKQTMLAGLVVFSLASLAYLWVNPRLLLLIRFLQGVGAAALSAVSLALVGAYAVERRGRAYGLYNGIKGAGYVVSPLIGGAIVLKANFSMIFVASAAIGALAFGLSLFLPRPKTSIKPSLKDDDDAIGLSGLLAVFRQSGLWPWYLVTVVNMFFVGILFGFLPVRIYALGYSPLINGVILTAVSASYLLIQPLAGAIADRVNPALTIRAGLLLAGTCVSLSPFVTGWLLLVIAILAGIGVGTVWTNTDALVSQQALAGKLGATMGVAGTFKEIGDMLGPLLIGVVSQAFGLTIGFVACGVLGLLALGLISDLSH
jgi:DHA1 family tetracycline resistance protein-like MFS transporter